MLAPASGNVVAYGNCMDDHEKEPDEIARPIFAHRPWMVGIVLVFAVVALIAGFSDPIWLLVGAPFILVLVLYIGVRIVTGIRGRR